MSCSSASPRTSGQDPSQNPRAIHATATRQPSRWHISGGLKITTSKNPWRASVLHPWRWTAGTCPHGDLVQIMFLLKWVMAVGSSRSSSTGGYINGTHFFGGDQKVDANQVMLRDFPKWYAWRVGIWWPLWYMLVDILFLDRGNQHKVFFVGEATPKFGLSLYTLAKNDTTWNCGLVWESSGNALDSGYPF